MKEKIKIGMKTPISYYGGKQMMLRYILPNIPKHDVYIEPFVGGGAVFWAKEPSKLEVINDTNRELINFYDVLKNDYVSLEKEVRISLHSRDLHRRAWVVYNNPDLFSSIKRAWAIWILSAQGFDGMLSESWGRDKTQNKTVKMIKNKRENFSEDFAIRLQEVELESRDAVKIIKTTQHKNSFIYADPPYYNADMGHYDGYTIEDFEMLLKALSNIEGKFLLSSYPSKILDEYVDKNGWHQFSVEMNVAVSNKGKKKIEVLTANYSISNPLK